jgi:hypothetical protein
MIVIEKTTDDNTGLTCWVIMDSVSHAVLDRCFDEADARDIADYYRDVADDPYAGDDEFDYEPDVSEFDEWQDFNPDC